MRIFVFLITALAMTVLSCDDKKPVQEEKVTLPELSTTTIEKSFQDCPNDSLSCTHVYIAFPQFTDSSKSEFNTIILSKLALIAEDFGAEGATPMRIEELASGFIKDYENFINEFSETAIGWYLKIESNILQKSEKYLSFQIHIESFTGGAHPNSSTSYYIYDVKSSKELVLTDIVSDTVEFKNIIEKAFRSQAGIAENASLADAGYWIEDGDFYLNNNIGLTEDKIIIHFNPYEIAPYSMGPTTIELEKTAVANNLKLK
jgi:hypothetical protein